MPELIEIFITAQYLNDNLKGMKLQSIKPLRGKYKRNPIKGLELLEKDLPVSVKSVNSKGKFLWFELSNGMFIKNRFGLTGGWSNERDENSNIEFVFKNNRTPLFIFYYYDQIGYGTMEISQTIDDELNKLAPDYIQDEITCESFYDRIVEYTRTKARKNHKIIKVLMEQNMKTGIGSGIGNYLVSEILYKAKMSPHTTMSEIVGNRTASDRLCKAIQYVIKNAFYNMNSDYMVDFDIDQIRRRFNIYKGAKIPNTFKFKVYDQKKDPKGRKVEKEEIVKGRKTHWIPSYQK